MQDFYNIELVDYAREEYPREACGLLVNVRGKLIFRPCKNISSSPEEDFIIDPLDQIRALHNAELVAIFHSHTKYDEQPSDQDYMGCKKTEVPWVIYSVLTKRYFTIQPVRKEDLPLSGREYIYGTYDCWNLVCDIYQKELNIELIRPIEEDPFWWKTNNSFINKADEAGFIQVKDIQKYDVLLMTTSNSPFPSHSAVYYGDNTIFHHAYRRLSCKEVYGGYWEKVTSHIFRHRSLIND